MSTFRNCMAVAGGMFLLVALPGRAADVLNLINGQFDATSKKHRTEIARDLQEEMQKLAQYLASPKPQESAWLRQESDAITKLGESDAATSRRVQLAESPEFQHAKLHSNLTAIRDALRCAADKNSSLSREMMCWGVASFLLTDRSALNDSISILLRAPFVPM